jgi:hypothetical protein
MVVVTLNGFLPSDFAGGAAPRIDFSQPTIPEYMQEYPPVEIRDARELQSGAESEAKFFAEHGFVLLPHGTAVKDWGTDIGSIYLPEIEDIIRKRLLPNRRVEVQQSPNLLRRGRGTSTPFYADGVHSDGPRTAEVYALNVAAFASEEGAQWWRSTYARDDVAGFVSIDFWRTTNMRGPLQHMPLALCEPNSVDPADMLPSSMVGIAPEGRTSHHLAMRYNPGQRWYFYPEVTSNELIAFKLSEFWKDDEAAHPQNVFHSAFRDPLAPSDAEERQSCEHRVGVLILR